MSEVLLDTANQDWSVSSCPCTELVASRRFEKCVWLALCLHCIKSMLLGPTGHSGRLRRTFFSTQHTKQELVSCLIRHLFLLEHWNLARAGARLLDDVHWCSWKTRACLKHVSYSSSSTAECGQDCFLQRLLSGSCLEEIFSSWGYPSPL